MEAGILGIPVFSDSGPLIKNLVLFSILFFSSSFSGPLGFAGRRISSQAVSLEMVWTLIASF